MQLYGALNEWISVDPEQIQHIEVSYVSQDNACESNYGSGLVTDNMLFAADPGEDSCQGDSGGLHGFCFTKPK